MTKDQHMSEKVESGLEVVAWRYTSSHSFGRTDQRWHYQETFPHVENRKVLELGRVDSLVLAEGAARAISDLGAELREANAEIQRQRERHRTTWTQLEQVKGLLREARSVVAVNDATSWTATLLESIDAALSQQTEPAPAQDEREAFEQAFVIQEGVYWSEDHQSYRSMNGRAIEERDAIDATMYWFGWSSRAELSTRPAQTEQQPVEMGELRVRLENGHKQFEFEEYSAAYALPDGTHYLYAAHITQTEQQPEQSLQCVPDETCRRLLFAFGLECNSIGLQGAAENLHKGMKTATSALSATPIPAMAAKEE